MKNLLATTATMAAAAAAIATITAPASALAPTAAITNVSASTATIVPDEVANPKVDFVGAAKASGMTLPTKKFSITSTFGQKGAYWSSGQHTGLDFAGAQGTPIFATDSGKVISAGSAGAYGNLIEIRHSDGVVTRYAHLHKIDVKKGDKVERGETIGALGTTGNSTGPHLHFEVLKNGKQSNPANFIPGL